MDETLQIRTLLLCSSKFAFPAIQYLAHQQWLTAVVIPANCKEVIGEVKAMLYGTGVVIEAVDQQSLKIILHSVMTNHQINLGLVATFNYFIPESIIALPAKGFFNIHPGILPMYRGADPIFHQIKNREKFAGVTIHFLTKEADAGNIVLLEKIHLLTDDTYGLLAEKLAQLSVQMLQTLFKIITMDFAVPSRPQNLSVAKYYKQQELSELAIDWHTMCADDIIALMNACNPHNKGAATKLGDKLIHLLYAEKNTNYLQVQMLPGTIIAIDDEEIKVAVINNELLVVKYVYINEGFLPPVSLKRFGLISCLRLENIF